MKRLLLAFLAFFPSAAQAQGPIQCSFATNPLPGYVYTYCGPSIGAVWTTPPGGISGPGVTVVDHVPTWADTIGLTLNETSPNRSSVLWNNAANYVNTGNYSGTTASAGIVETLGSTGTPDTTQNAVAVFQKKMGSTAATGTNPVVYIGGFKTAGANAANTRVSTLFVETLDQAGWNGVGINNFSEGLRVHDYLASGTLLGSAYGVVSSVGDNPGAVSHTYLISNEAEVYNQTADAPGTLNALHFTTSYLATSAGTKTMDAAFMVNPFLGASNSNTAAYRRGFYVPAGAGAVTIPVIDCAFCTEGASQWALNATKATGMFGGLGVPNNVAAVRAMNVAGNAQYNLIGLDSSNNEFICLDPLIVQCTVGNLATQIAFEGSVIQILNSPPPGNPPAAHIFLYVSNVDGKLYARGPTGTITLLANP